MAKAIENERVSKQEENQMDVASWTLKGEKNIKKVSLVNGVIGYGNSRSTEREEYPLDLSRGTLAKLMYYIGLCAVT